MRNTTKYVFLSALFILIVYPFRQRLEFLFQGLILFLITYLILNICERDFSKSRKNVANYFLKFLNH